MDPLSHLFVETENKREKEAGKDLFLNKLLCNMCSGQMVSVIVLQSKNPTSNPAGVSSFYSVKMFDKYK